MPGHRITKGLAWLSALASLLVAAVELVRVIQLLYRIDQRYRAWYGGYETIYDSQYSTCAYFVSGTDQPLHVGAVAFAPLWHCFNIVFLILIFLAEIPGTTRILAKLGQWCKIFAQDAGVWPTGALQLLIALAILGTVIVFPDGPAVLSIDDTVVRMLRLVAAMILLAVGAMNISLGMIHGGNIRIWRGQAHEPSEEEQMSDDEKAAHSHEDVAERWTALKATLATVTGSGAFGPLYDRVQAMDKAVSDLV